MEVDERKEEQELEKWQLSIEKQMKLLDNEKTLAELDAINEIVSSVISRKDAILRKYNFHELDRDRTEEENEIVMKEYEKIAPIIDKASEAIFKKNYIEQYMALPFYAIDALGYLGGQKAYDLLMEIYSKRILSDEVRVRFEIAFGLMNPYNIIRMHLLKPESYQEMLGNILLEKSWKEDFQLTLLSTGQSYIEKQDYQNALKFSQRAIRNDNQDYKAWSEVGFIYFAQKDHKKAENAYNMALKIKPDCEVTIKRLCALLVTSKQYRKTIDFTDSAISLCPNEADLWFNRGYALLNINQIKKGKICIQQCLKINPNHQIASKIIRDL